MNTSAVRSSRDVAYRVLAVRCACYRASGEQVLRQGGDLEWTGAIEEARRWVRETGIDEHFSAFEEDLIFRPIGELGHQELFIQGWRIEAAFALLWSLGKVDPMPSYGSLTPASKLGPLIPKTGPIDGFVEEARLRPVAELLQERTRARFWNWRGRCEMFRRQGQTPPSGQSYQETIEAAARSALESGLIDQVVEGDAALGGTPYSRLADQEFADAASMALERHHALNWVLGEGDDWDEVPTDT